MLTKQRQLTMIRNFTHPPLTPPKKTSLSTKNPRSSNFSSPPPRNQSPPRNLPHSPPPTFNSSLPSHISDEFRILKISVSSSWREIKHSLS